MEKAKQISGSSSSITSMDDLFGPQNSSKSPSSSTTLFGSIFGPPPKNSSHYDSTVSSRKMSNRKKARWNSSKRSIQLMGMEEISNHVTLILPYIMVAKKFILHQAKIIILSIFSRRTEEMLTQMKTALTAPQEEIGGKDLYIIEAFHLLFQIPSQKSRIIPINL